MDLNESTNNNSTRRDWGSLQWITCQIASTVMTITCTYVLICLVIYELQLQSKTTSRNNSSVTETSFVPPTSRQVELASRSRKQKQKWLRYMTIMCTFCAMFKGLVNQLDLFFGTYSYVACTTFSITAICGYGGSLFFVYLMLWLRQYIVQSHSALRHLPHKKVRIYGGRILLALMLMLFGSLFVLNFVTIKVKPSSQGCVFADMGKISQSARSSAGLIFTIIFQPAFAALLLYPLLKKLPSNSRNSSLATLSKRQPTSGPRKKNSVEQVRILIRRILIAIAMVTASDIGAIVGTFLLEADPIIYVALIYDANALVGIASVIYSFGDWRQRFVRKKVINTESKAIA